MNRKNKYLLNRKVAKVTIGNRMHELEKVLYENFPLVECPLIHRFTKGMYIREIYMPKNTVVVSQRHLTQHPFVISMGKVSVSINGVMEYMEAPYTGITEPDTKRTLHIHEDTIWTTFHPIPIITGQENFWIEEDKAELVDLICGVIIDTEENPLLGGRLVENNLVKTINK